MMENSSQSLNRLFKCLEEEREFEISGVSSSSAALILYEAFKHTGKQIVYLSPSVKRAEEVLNDVLFFRNADRKIKYKYSESRTDILVPWDTLPYEDISPFHEISSRRVEFLSEMMDKEGIFIVPAESLVQKLIPRSSISGKKLSLDTGGVISRDLLLNYLLLSGYKRKDFVEEKGDFSIRGGIADIFSGLHDFPIRIEFFGDEISSIREFDPHSQRSVKKVLSTALFPVREVAYPENNSELLEVFDLFFEDYPDRNRLMQLRERFERREYFPGVENYLPLFHKTLETTFDYNSEDSIVILEEKEKIFYEIETQYREAIKKYDSAVEKGQPVIEPQYIYSSCEEIKKKLCGFKRIDISSISSGDDSLKFTVKRTSYMHVQEDLKSDRFSSVAEEIKKKRDEGYRIYITARSGNSAERMIAIFMDYHLSMGMEGRGEIVLSYTENREPFPPLIIIGNLTEGFFVEELGIAFITEEDIFGKKHSPYRRKILTPLKLSSSFQSLKEGDYIVHVNYGIGRFLGIAQMSSAGRTKDFLMIEYQDNEKLYVPSENLNLVQKYIGVKGSKPVIEKLGSQNWARVKQKAKKAIETMAKGLLELYADRQFSLGISFSQDDNWMREFENRFEYDETPHQLRAIKDVKKDMESVKPMDRLICGDVGFGKTEVAMRAAFKAVLDGKQVSVLVPTTILAHQHYQTFSERFSHFPVKVEMLSRFCNLSKQKEIMNGIREKKVDIVIGTHKLLMGNVEFNDLGLLIVDEEHRFGVRHKEKIKDIARNIDVLTLTATPIPRTLQLSLTGIRDISIIDTPPEERLPIKTVVIKFNREMIVRAIKNELERGGQVYFVHNNVKSLPAMEMFLKNNIPEVRIGVAHGQMKPSELEKIMVDFVERQFDLLLCTTIIESGLDIPAVNTIVINRADRLGLAQLYQLRGRVGRSNIEAFAYLLVPADKDITDEARKRLMVIEELTDFGSGFKIAAHDLEIRGAGNILGEAQSGNIASIGYDLYCQLVEETVAKLRGRKEKLTDCKIEVKVNAFIPEEFIRDSMERVSIYKKISEISDFHELDEFKKEIVDRYGEIPLPFENVFLLSRLRILAAENCIERISDSKDGFVLYFSEAFVPSAGLVTHIATSKKYPLRFLDDRSMLVKTPLNNREGLDLALNILEFLKKAGIEKV